MAFDSNILSENYSDNNKNNFRNDAYSSYVYGIIELNDKMHEIETSNSIKNYRALKEDAVNESNGVILSDKEIKALQEGIISDFKEKLNNAINAIIEFIKKFINMLTQKDLKVRLSYRRMVSRTKNFVNIKKNEKEYTFTIYNYPNLRDIDDNKCRASLNNIISSIDAICSGNFEPAVSDSSLEMAYRALARIVKTSGRREYNNPIEDKSSFSDFVKTDIVYTEHKQETYGEWRESIKNIVPTEKSVISSKLSGIKEDLEKCRTKIDNAEIVDEQSRNNLNTLISQIKSIISSYTWYLNYIYDMETMQLNYIMNTYNKISGSVNESGFIHGEPFNSDTLFDNEDLRDFNPTEWLDLSLTAECFQIKYELDESRKRIALGEANIMSDNDPSKKLRLSLMREAEGENTNNRIANIFKSIKQLIDKFINTIKEKVSNTSKFIQKNGDFINKPIKIEKVSSKGDIISGMYRIQKSINIVPFNYENMKEDLKDEKTFFVKHILPSLKESSNYSKRDTKWNDDMKITDYCKSYFGAPVGGKDSQDCVFTGAEIEQNKQNIVKFLNRPSILQSINNEINELEKESKKVTSKITNPQPNENKEENNNETKELKANNESMYYSELYSKWINEANIEMSNNSEKDDNNNNENQKESSEEIAAFNKYMNCYRSVIASKMTAAEFIINEMMQIMNAHARSYMNKEQKAEMDKEKQA